MATVTSSVGGQDVTVTNSSQSVADLAQSILQASGVTAVDTSATLAGSYFAATGTTPATVTGGQTVTVGVLSGQNGVFNTGTSIASVIVAGDNTNSAVINSNPGGSLIAFTGAGGNALVGSGLINGFQTGVGGQDAIIFSSANPLQVNSLTSQGMDTVSILGAPAGAVQANSVTAVGAGSDVINLLNGASVSFVNLSSATSVINASEGSTVSIGGTGNTSVVAGAGTEAFSVNTSSGNVTLVGSISGGVDTFDFVKLSQGVSTGVDVVTNFTAADSVNLTGFGVNGYVADTASNPGSTTLTLTDGSKIVFAGIGDASQVTSRIASA